MRRAEAGLFNGNKSNLYGYRYSSGQGLIIDEEESIRVREMFDWFTEHGWGIEKIAKTLNLRGVSTKTGIQWSANTIAVMLRNQVYSGQVRANGSFIEGQHQAIVSREQQELVATIIKSRANLPPRSHDSVHLLSGIAHCGQCGKRLTVHHINKGPNKKRYKFYYHKTDIKVGENLCSGLAKSAQMLEAAVVEQIARCAELKLMRKVVLADVKGRQNKGRVSMVKEWDRLLLKREELSETFSRWADRLDAGKIDEDQFDRQNQRLLAQKKELQLRLDALEEELAQEENLEVTLTQVRKVLDEFPMVWDSLEPEE